eukprot:55865_1
MVAFITILISLLVDINLSSYASMTCYIDGGYVNDWDDHFDNIQAHYFMNGVVESVHNNSKADRRWRFRYCKPTNANPTWISQFAMSSTQYDETYHRDCYSTQQHSALIGGRSDHDIGKEDREWEFHCGTLNITKYLLTMCYDTRYLNTWDSTFSFYCPNNGVMRKVYSEHNNGGEDRLWAFVCCRIQDAPTAVSTYNPTPASTDFPTIVPTYNPTPAPTDASTPEGTGVTWDDVTRGQENRGRKNGALMTLYIMIVAGSLFV